MTTSLPQLAGDASGGHPGLVHSTDVDRAAVAAAIDGAGYHAVAS
jgi:hypothetical protein